MDEKKKQLARKRAQAARRAGRLIAAPCTDCGASEVEMHHDDYERPLEVVWLCQPCHHARHGLVPQVGHGRLIQYRRGCRCTECRAAKKRDRDAWKARRRARSGVRA